MKIVSLNLWFGGVLFDKIIPFLSEQDADIVLLQEAYNGADPSLPDQYRSMEVLQSHLSYAYNDFVAEYLDFDRADGKAQRGNAILSKFPIIERSALFFDKPYGETYRDIPGNAHNCPRNVQHVLTETPQGELHVFNMQGVWDLDGDNNSVQRQRMSDSIIKFTTGKAHVVLGGDTNAKPTNKAICRIEGYLKSVFGDELQTTFNMRRKSNPGYAAAAVDMFFVSEDIHVTSHTCVDADISDHLPLVVTFDFK
jgi:endonuclease/exonuclease/phosphatase family metal-dependent hydrolase